MSKVRPVVAIVDDDPRLLESLEELLESAGYAGPQLSLRRDRCSSAGCRAWTCSSPTLGCPGWTALNFVTW